MRSCKYTQRPVNVQVNHCIITKNPWVFVTDFKYQNFGSEIILQKFISNRHLILLNINEKSCVWDWYIRVNCPKLNCWILLINKLYQRKIKNSFNFLNNHQINCNKIFVVCCVTRTLKDLLFIFSFKLIRLQYIFIKLEKTTIILDFFSLSKF